MAKPTKGHILSKVEQIEFNKRTANRVVCGYILCHFAQAGLNMRIKDFLVKLREEGISKGAVPYIKVIQQGTLEVLISADVESQVVFGIEKLTNGTIKKTYWSSEIKSRDFQEFAEGIKKRLHQTCYSELATHYKKRFALLWDKLIRVRDVRLLQKLFINEREEEIEDVSSEISWYIPQ